MAEDKAKIYESKGDKEAHAYCNNYKTHKPGISAAESTQVYDNWVTYDEVCDAYNHTNKFRCHSDVSGQIFLFYPFEYLRKFFFKSQVLFFGSQRNSMISPLDIAHE